MARWRYTGYALCVALLGCLALSSCDGVPGSARSAGPVQGGSIIYALDQEPTSLLPQLNTERADAVADQALWAPLWYLDPHGALQPGLAKEVPSLTNGGISADLKTWTIRLRPGLRWSDDSPLTSADLAFSLNLYADPHFPGSLPKHDPTDPTDFLGAVTLDATTVRFSLAHPNVTLLGALQDAEDTLIPRELFGAMKPGDILTSPQSFRPTVSSGPFIVKEHVQGDHLTVVRNPHYYQGPAKPYLDQITFRYLGGGQDAILAALQAGQIDAVHGLDFTQMDRYQALVGYSTGLDEYPTGYEAIAFNLTNPILKDLAVRQALAMTLNPRLVMAEAIDGLAMPTCDDHAGTFAHEPTLTCYAQDPGQAARLLDQDGWALAADGYRYKDGRRLELRYSSTNLEHRVRTERLAQAVWGRLGIKIDVQIVPSYAFYPPLLNGTFDIDEFFVWGGTYDSDDSTTFMCDQTPDHGGFNFMHYCNPAVDHAEMQQQLTADENVRKAAFHAIHMAVLADLPMIYLYTPRLVRAYRQTLHNYAPRAVGGGETWNVWDWYVQQRAPA